MPLSLTNVILKLRGGIMNKESYNKKKIVSIRLNKREEDKLIKIQEKLQLRDYSKTIRELIRKERI